MRQEALHHTAFAIPVLDFLLKLKPSASKLKTVRPTQECRFFAAFESWLEEIRKVLA